MLKKIDWLVDQFWSFFGCMLFTVFAVLSFFDRPACLQLDEYTFGVCREFLQEKKALHYDRKVIEAANKRILEENN